MMTEGIEMWKCRSANFSPCEPIRIFSLSSGIIYEKNNH